MRLKEQLSLRSALLYIVLSVTLISGSTVTLRWWQSRTLERRSRDGRYTIQSIVQTGPERLALSTTYFAELLGLSIDRPVNLYAVELTKMVERLEESPVILSAKMGRLGKETLSIDYAVREPVALVADWTNCAVDWTSRLFPLSPFYTPKRLPELYIGQPLQEGVQPWESCDERPSLTLGLEVLKKLQSSPFSKLRVERIDTSKAFSASWGRREMVMRVIEGGDCHLLRLRVEEYEKALYNYLILREELARQGRGSLIIDLRIEDLAYLSRR
jgi:hypothetical protein